MFWIFRRKPLVEKYEEEFKKEEMKKRRVYYDLSFRTGDPEKLRAFIARLFENFNYKVIINKLTKFEEIEEEIFVGGRLKPVRGVIKGVKDVDFGLKHPGKLAFFLTLSVMFLILSFLRNWDMLLLKISFVTFVISLLLLIPRKKITLSIWAKISGIYDPSTEKSDIKLTLAGDLGKYDKRAEEILESDMNTIYITISEEYLKERGEEYYVIKEGKKPWEIEESKKDEVIKMITMLRKDLETLDSRYARGEITREEYEELRERIRRRLEKYEAILEFFT